MKLSSKRLPLRLDDTRAGLQAFEGNGRYAYTDIDSKLNGIKMSPGGKFFIRHETKFDL